MKNLICIFVVSCLAVGCGSQPKNINEYTMTEPLKHIVDSFVRTVPDQTVYELYIDKIYPDSSIIILFAGKKSLTESENSFYKQFPLICLQSNDQVIKVYSGIERYIRHIGNSQPDTDTDSFWANGSDFAGKYLILFDVRGNLSVDNGDRSGAYPFFTLPVVSKLKFTAPTIKDSGTY